MHIYKSVHKGISFDIVLPKNESSKIIFILPGMPEYPRPKGLMLALANLGYIVVYPKYRGTFESKGSFLVRSPAYDILDLIDLIEADKEIVELFGEKKIKLKVEEINILASSFGGSVALHLSKLTNKIRRYILAAPVIDFKKHNERKNEQDLVSLERFLKKGYPFIYRFEHENYKRLLEGKVIPSSFSEMNRISGDLIFIHSYDDPIVSIKNTEEFLRRFKKCKLIRLEEKGHLSVSKLDLELIMRLLS